MLAQRSGLRIHEVPVDWIDDPDSRVDIVRTAKEDLRGAVAQPAASLPSPLSEVPRGMMGQIVRFGAIGVLSSLAYLVIYLGLREFTGAQAANLVALLVTAFANTAVNRRVTFRVQGRAGILKHQTGGLIAFGIGLGLTSGSLWLLHTLDPGRHRGAELVVLILANAVATVLRFLALRQLMGASSPRRGSAGRDLADDVV